MASKMLARLQNKQVIILLSQVNFHDHNLKGVQRIRHQKFKDKL